MLPGFRFLFAAIVLSMSILVFGLGAAALLRAAHEEFASTPSWHASPEPVFAQRTETPGSVTQGPVTQGPVLAMLQVEPPAAEEKAPDQVAAATMPAEQPVTTAIPAEPEVTAKPAEPEITATLAEPEVTAVPAEPERTAAALQPENSSQPETAKTEMPIAESPAQQEAAPAQAVAPAATDETRMATSTPTSAAASNRHRHPKKSPRRRAKLPRQRLNKRACPLRRTPTAPRSKSPRWAAHPSRSKQRRQWNPPSQGMPGASSGSAWKRGGRPGIAGSRRGHASYSNYLSSRPTRSVSRLPLRDVVRAFSVPIESAPRLHFFI